MAYLPCVEIEPDQSANRSVIWLHGLGADGNDFAPIVPFCMDLLKRTYTLCVSARAANPGNHQWRHAHASLVRYFVYVD